MARRPRLGATARVGDHGVVVEDQEDLDAEVEVAAVSAKEAVVAVEGSQPAGNQQQPVQQESAIENGPAENGEIEMDKQARMK